MKKVTVWILISALVIAGGVLSWVLFLRSSPATIQFSGAADPVAVTIADTDAKREQGLSGHAPLGENEGMLFVFDAPGRPQFWMKDMLFPLDIIWISSGWTVADISPDLAPETYPNSFSPASDAQYVLEVPAGFAKAHGVEIGQSLTFKK